MNSKWRPPSDFEFSVQLRHRRLKLNLTQLSLARRAGVTEQYISRLETTREGPSDERRHAIEDALSAFEQEARERPAGATAS